jgi:hypothetical protein
VLWKRHGADRNQAEPVTLAETTPAADGLDTEAGVIDEARRRQRRRRGRVSGLAFAILVAALVAHGIGGGGPRKPHTTASDSAPLTPVGHELSFRSRRGPAQASFTMHEGSGVILLAQIAAPPGVRAFVDATNPYGGATRITTVVAPHDSSLVCRLRGGLEVCTQAMEACPMTEATWRFRVVKLSGPGGPVRVDFVVGARPLQA